MGSGRRRRSGAVYNCALLWLGKAFFVFLSLSLSPTNFAKGGTNVWDLSLVVVVVIVVLVVVRNLILPNLAKACRGVVEPIDDCCSYKIEKERDQTWEC